MKNIGEYIKAKREEEGLSIRELANKAGISYTHVGFIEKSQRKPTFDIVMKIVNALKIDMNDFLKKTELIQPVQSDSKSEEIVRLKRVPIISWALANKWHEIKDVLKIKDVNKWVKSDITCSNIFAVEIIDDSMEPEFTEGDIIIVNPHIEVKPDDYVIAKNDKKDQAILRQLRQYEDIFVLHPLNPKYHDEIVKKDIQKIIVGKVIKKERKYE